MSCQERAKSQGTTFSMKCPILDKQKQISFGRSFRTRFPHSSQLSSLMEPGTQPNRSCLLRLSNEETSSQRLRPKKRPLIVVCRDRNGGEVHSSSRPGPRLLEGHIEGSRALQDVVPSLFPGTSSSPTCPRLGDLQAHQKNA